MIVERKIVHPAAFTGDLKEMIRKLKRQKEKEGLYDQDSYMWEDEYASVPYEEKERD